MRRTWCMQLGWTGLLIACQDGHLEVVKYLCETGGEKLMMKPDKVSCQSFWASVYACMHVQECCTLCHTVWHHVCCHSNGTFKKNQLISGLVYWINALVTLAPLHCVTRFDIMACVLLMALSRKTNWSLDWCTGMFFWLMCMHHDAQTGVSCLFLACQNGHFEIVKYLCELGGEKLMMMTATEVSFIINNTER